MKNYEEVLSLDDDPRFGSIKILCDSNNPRDRVMLKKEQFKTSNELEFQAKIAERRAELFDSKLQKIKNFDIDKQNLSIDFYYEYLDEFLVLKELKDEEILKLFEDICKAIIQGQQIEQHHGDIRPELVSFDSSKNFYLLQKKDQQKDVSDIQKENIQSYKPIYISPEIFERIMRHQKLQGIQISKSDLFSLGFMCLEAFEEHDFLQEFYDFNKGIFDYESMNDKLSLLTKRNLPEKIQEFLLFLKHYVLVQEEKRISPQEALEFVQDIQEGKKLFESTNHHDLQTNENVQYYNPFDFLNTSDIIPRTASIDNRMNRNNSPSQKMDFRHRDESLIDISQNAKVHKSIGKNSILVVTDNKEAQSQNQINGSDIKDVIENLKFFKLKLKDPIAKQPNEQKFKGKFYPIKKNQSKESTPKKTISANQNDEDMYNYLQKIGLEANVKEINATSELDKKLRETAKFESTQDISNFDKQLVQKSKKNTNLRGFLNKNTEKPDIKVEKQKSAKKIDKAFTIVKQFKNENLQQQRDKSARKLMMNNYNILAKKSSKNIDLQISQQSQEIESFNQDETLLSKDNQVYNQQNNRHRNTIDSIEKITDNKIHNSAQNQVQTPKRNYQPSSLQFLDQKRTTKSYKQEGKKQQKKEIHPISQQFNNVQLIKQNFSQQNKQPSKVVSVKKITYNGFDNLKTMKSSNFLNCYNDQYLQQYSTNNSKQYSQSHNPQLIYNTENLKERESWKNLGKNEQIHSINHNLHLYQKFEQSPQTPYQMYSARNLAQNTHKTLQNTIVNIPHKSSLVEERQSTQWINSVIPSQRNIQKNQAYNFQKKVQSYRHN